jgi:hypothetical protein
MGLIYDNNESRGDSSTNREPLTDAAGAPLPSGEAESAPKPRRRSLSNVREESAAEPPQPESKPQRRKLSVALEERPEEQQAQAAPTPGGLIDLNALPGTQKSSVGAESPGSTEAEPLLGQAQPTSGRPRLTLRGPHAGVAEPPQDDTAPDGQTDADAKPEGQTPGARPGRARLTPPVPGSGEPRSASKSGRARLTSSASVPEAPESTPKSGRARLTSPASAPEVPESTPKSGRARLTSSAPAPETSESTSNVGRPRTSAPEPEVEPAEPRVKAHRPRLGEQKEDMNATSADGQAPLDPVRIQQVVAQLKAKQNLPLALLAGVLTMAVAAVLWAAVTVTANYRIGYMALAAGFLVGGAVRVAGRGVGRSFGWLGAVLSVGGCLLGNLLTNCVFIARETDLPLKAVLEHLGENVTAGLGLMVAFHPLDLVFYGIAIYAGYRFSFRRLTETRIRRLIQANSA